MGLFSSLVGAISGKREGSKNRKFAAAQAHEDRKFQLMLRDGERSYSQAQTARDRVYAERLLRDDRDYVRRMTADQRSYDRTQTHQSRLYDAKLLRDQRAREDAYDARNQSRLQTQLRDDRSYSEARLADDRAYMDRLYREDKNRYAADRDLMQSRSDGYAEKTAASRGIDFTKLRDDAVKAGYNPMTALSMAHAYSTQVDYQLQGGVYSPRANYTAAGGSVPTGAGYAAGGAPGAGGGGGGSYGGGGGSPMPMSTPIASQVPAGGSFSAGGAGYTSSPSPGLTAASFFADALDKSMDNWFSTPAPRDELADALRKALEVNSAAEDAKAAQMPKGFGYDLTEIKPFKPALSTGVPAMRKPGTEMRPRETGRPTPAPYRQEYITVRHPNGQMGRLDSTIARRLDIKKGDVLTAGEWTELMGDVVGEANNTVHFDNIQKTATGAGPFRDGFQAPQISQYTRDYLESGRTGRKMMSNPKPDPDWITKFINMAD